MTPATATVAGACYQTTCAAARAPSQTERPDTRAAAASAVAAATNRTPTSRVAAMRYWRRGIARRGAHAAASATADTPEGGSASLATAFTTRPMRADADARAGAVEPIRLRRRETARWTAAPSAGLAGAPKS